MKLNWKKLIALITSALLMLSMTGLGEDENVIGNDMTAEVIDNGDIAIDESPVDLESLADTLDSIDLQEDLVDIPSLDTPSQVAGDAVDDENPIALGQSEDNAAADITLGVNESYTLSTKGLGKGLTFESSKPKIVSVTDKGVVKGLKKGTAQISILSGSKVKAKYTVKVVAAPIKVTLPSKTITLGVKESMTMTPAIPKNTHTTFTWTSKNKKIATVSKAGKITGKKVGNTTVTVQTHNGKTATLKVVVKAAPKKVTLNKTSLKMELYDEFQLKATLPKGSFSNKLTWTSSDEDVVNVFEDGWLFANAPGSATITVKTYNGKKATCKVTVVEEEEDTPTPEPTAEPTPEPTAEPTPEPTTEPTPEPTPEPTAEPTPEPAPKPTPKILTLSGDLPQKLSMGFYPTKQEYMIDSFKCELVECDDDTYQYKFSFGGVKTKDIDGDFNFTQYPINWELYGYIGDNYVLIDRGVIKTPLVRVGDRWSMDSCYGMTKIKLQYNSSIELSDHLFIHTVLS